MNRLKYLIIHCSATKEGRDFTGFDVEQWHKNRGWSRPGYRSVIRLDGVIDKLVEANHDAFVQDNEMTWGAKGVNGVSHHVCYIGGLDKDGFTSDTRTKEQLESMESIVRYYIERINPEIKIAGHYAFSRKDCPSFNVPKWLKSIGINSDNIHFEDPYNIGKTLK